MGRSAIVGAFGIGRQSAKDSAASSFAFMPAQSVALSPQQNVSSLPMEVGGQYMKRGSYKASIMGMGDVGLVVRPNSIGHMLYGLTGSDTPTVIAGQNNAAYQHVFGPFLPAAGVDLPWYTAAKDISKLFAELYTNTKVRGLNLSIPKASIVTAQTSLISTTPSTVTSASLGSETLDTSPYFQTCVATTSLVKQSDSSVISANSSRFENITMQFTNTVSEDEFEIGSYSLADITLLSRAASVNFQTVVRDPALYQAVYQNGGTVPNSWSPTLYRGSFTLTLTSSTTIPGSNALPYSLTITFPGLDFMAMPIDLQGNELVRASLAAEVSLGTSGSDQYSFTLVNGVASY